MAFIYNLTDSWTDAATTWNGIKLAVTNTASSASSNLLNLTVTGATTASFVVDKSGNLALNGTVNKITMTAPATGATLTLANNSTFITSGAYSSTFTFTGTTTLTFPTSGTVTALGNTTTGSGSIVLSNSPSLVTPALGTPSSVTLTNATGLPLTTGVTGTLAIANGGTGQTTANAAFNALAPSQTGNNGKYLTTDGSNTSWADNPLGTVTSVNVSGGTTGISFSGGPITTSGTITMSGTLAVANGGTGITSFGTGVATALGQNVTGSGGIVLATSPTLVTPALGTPSSATLTNATGLPISTGVSGLGSGVATFLATPSSANLASAVTDETGSGSLVFGTSPTIGSPTITGTATFNGSTSGTVALKAPAVAGTTTFQLPSGNGTSGYVLVTDGLGNTSWASSGGAAGNAAGVNKNVQFNDAGSMAGNAAFNFDKATASLSLGVASTTTGKLAFYNASSANATTIQAGNASSAVTYTLPTADGTSGQALITNGSGALSWTTIASGLTVGSTAISGGTTTRILYDNAGVLGEYSVIPVSLGGTNATSASITAFNNITGYTATGATGTTSTNIVFSTSPTITTPTISGNETYTGSAGRILADFDNATVNSRRAFQTSTTNASTGIYALPNGTSQASSWQAANNSDPTNASKILIATNGTTDVQLVSGINGTGTYLPLSIYTSGGQSAQFSTTKGTLSLGVAGTAAGVLSLAGSTSGSVTLGVPAVAGTTTFTLPGSNGTSGQALTTNGSGVTTWTTITGGATGGGTDAIFWNNGQTVTADYTVPSATNSMSAGPISINSGITVTISAGSNWIVI